MGRRHHLYAVCGTLPENVETNDGSAASLTRRQWSEAYFVDNRSGLRLSTDLKKIFRTLQRERNPLVVADRDKSANFCLSNRFAEADCDRKEAGGKTVTR